MQIVAYDKIIGDINSDDTDAFAFAGSRLAIILFANLTPSRGCGGESGV